MTVMTVVVMTKVISGSDDNEDCGSADYGLLILTVEIVVVVTVVNIVRDDFDDCGDCCESGTNQ